MPETLASESPALPERIPLTPPVIRPVAGPGKRPQWSVMIPTYNCLPYLRETLESVLAQAPSPADMQIAVVDDTSTDGDVAALVQAVGQGRVQYYQQPQNVGSLRNFETCLNRATGHWVHMLHGDDCVAPGFYAEIAALFGQYPEAGAAFTNTADVFMRPTGAEVSERPPIAPAAGIVKDLLLRLATGQQLETPSIVVKRLVYEQLGGFFAVHYGEDWEMWARIAARFPVAYSPKCLARYRYLNSTSISHRHVKTGQNIRDITTVITLINAYLPAEHRKHLKRSALRHYATYCLSLVDDLYATDPAAARTQIRGAVRISPHPGTIFWALKAYLKNLVGFKRANPAPQP
ncbi:MAG: glycosyltransferase family 2 protein [Janthinobacterium lividum]